MPVFQTIGAAGHGDERIATFIAAQAIGWLGGPEGGVPVRRGGDNQRIDPVKIGQDIFAHDFDDPLALSIDATVVAGHFTHRDF